jgi:hypothetical protein
MDKSVATLVAAITFGISMHVSKIADVSDFLLGATMSHIEGVVVGTSSSAALGEISKLVNVEPVLVAGGKTSKVTDDAGFGEHRGLFKLNNAVSGVLGLRFEDADGAARLLLVVHVGDGGGAELGKGGKAGREQSKLHNNKICNYY